MRQYFTTPIYYVNGSPHIGHCYTGILTDVLTRTWVMNGYDVRMQTGTDEHGNKVEQAAKAAGIENTIEFCNATSGKFRELMLATNLCCSYDNFDSGNNFYHTENKNFANGKNYIRTTEEKHKKSVKELWQTLGSNGWIYKDSYKGWYAIRDEAFYEESEIIDGKAPSGAPVEWREEEAYFFRLSNFQDILINFYESNGKEHLPPFVRNEIIAFMKGGLRDLCISRIGLEWGIRVPGDENHAVYVWLDALQNYVSALSDEKDKWWDGVDKKTHVIGKDIIRFHAIYWPAFLIGSKYKIGHLPDQISEKTIPHFVVHGWWLNNGEKMSKSLNNSLDPYAEIEFVKNAIDTSIKGVQNEGEIALDYFRYFLIKAMPSGSDGNYSREKLVENVNSDIVNNIGNLANRVFSLVFKNPINQKNISDMEDGQASLYLPDQTAVLQKSSHANRLIDEHAPWNLLKEGRKAEFDNFMLERLVDIYTVVLNIRPMVPFIAESILDYMCIPYEHRNFLPKNSTLIVFKAIENGIGCAKIKDINDNYAFTKDLISAPYPITPRLKI